MAEPVELLFFDTFSHESSEELNLDLVQFPKPVFVTEVRIIPLGARVQADFPGGVRLGATNPSQFSIEFFVNDLGKPGASTFESLGGFEYNQNGCIHLECTNNEVNARQIPTDGLVLRGWYTTITLAVYGTLTKNITEQVIPPAANTPSITQQPTALVSDVQQIVSANPIDQNWQQDVNIPPVPMEYNQSNPVNYGTNYGQTEGYSQDYHYMEYGEPPKDPRYHHTPESEWDQKSARQRDSSRPRDVDADRHYSRSHSRDRERRDYRETSRERDRERDWDRERSQSTEYRDRDRSYKHQEPYKRTRDNSYGRGISAERDENRKRPRTPPPMASPKRPHTPHGDKDLSPGDVESISEDEIAAGNIDKTDSKTADALTQNTKQLDAKQTVEQKKLASNESGETVEEASQMDLEQFEPILSDEDICDESETFADGMDYDFAAYSNNDDVIKLFNPISVDLQKYRDSLHIDMKRLMAESAEEMCAFTKINNYFATYNEQVNGLIEFLKAHTNTYAQCDFKNLSAEVKEEYVNVCEQLPVLLVNNRQYLYFTELLTLVSNGTIRKTNHFGPFYEDLKTVHRTLMDFVKLGLDFECALTQNQPGYKIRHIKCGVRLTESCCGSADFVNLLLEHNIHIQLLTLFDKEYMALSIKLLILRVLDASLTSEKSIEQFISKRIADQNGYQMLINIMKSVTSVRIKFAVNSLMTKLNMYEVLKKMRATILSWCKKQCDTASNEHSDRIPEEALTFVLQALEQILKLYQRGSFEISQPRRFLPVSAQFEINRTTDEKNDLYSLFSMHQFLECVLILLTHPRTSQCTPIVTTISELISELLNSADGIRYLSEHMECTRLLVKCFLHPEDLEAQYILSEAVYIKSQSLGLSIAYRMQVLYHVECLCDIGGLNQFDCDAKDVLDQLHAFYCLTYVNIGKLSCSDIISLGDNVKCLLQFLNWSNSDAGENDCVWAKLKKSSAVGYIADLLALTVTHSSYVPFLEKYGKQILQIALQHDKFETTTAAKLNEILIYLKPLELAGANVFSSDDIKPLCEIIKQNIENVTNFPGHLITSLRILKHLGISSHNNGQSPILLENSSYNLVELKYKYVILQLYSLDGVSNLVTILQKICTFYEQPSLHIATFSSGQGVLIMNTVLPCVQLLRQMLMLVIHCRNTEFKDLTAVPALLQTFNMAHSFPPLSIAFGKSREVCKEIIDTLLVYSQPVSDEISENDSLNKTLWTLMAGEVIKYITILPYTFMPGLLIFSELLPLPLPFQSGVSLTDDEVKRAINLRKLWSAHLHSHSTSIQELINRLCTSVHQPLLHLLRRVCIQLSDLAANTAIMIARGVLDSVHTALTPKSDKVLGNSSSSSMCCNGHTARLLHFLACLTTHGAIKCAVLQLLWNHSSSSAALKTDEKYPSLVNMFCHVLKTESDANSHLQAQECIVNIIQNLCDTEITLLQSIDGQKCDITSDIYLSNSLPPKDLLITILTTLLDHFTCDNTFTTLLPIVRTFILLTEHDYGFYHLCVCFEKKPNCFLNILKKFISCFAKDNAELLQTLSTVLDLLRVCCDDMEIEGTLVFAPRSVKMSAKELKQLVAWKCEDDVEDNSKHQFYVLENLIKKNTTSDEPFNNMLDNLASLIRVLNCESSGTDTASGTVSVSIPEPVLPAPDTLLGQFACRPVYTLTEVSEEQLTTAYWLSAPAEEIGGEIDLVAADLSEVCRQNLSAEVNISREVEKLIRVYPSQESDRQTSEQLKVKRTMNEAQRNDKLKKPYVTPMRGRGFPRTAPQRGDLFRSRPPNTSRPPSLHVDDFVALETAVTAPSGAMSTIDEREDYLKNPFFKKHEYGDFTPFYITITICTVFAAIIFIANIILGCCSRHSHYWNDQHTGNRWILPLWTSTPHKQPPLDLSELDVNYIPPKEVFYEEPQASEYLELTKRESDI
ncbi:virilizer [Carabus blaptoides fortunei]